ncbi:MAG: hypothetical protein DMF60_02960, partial [Acidobacteria bacterium]
MYTELFETIYPINTPTKEKGVVVTAVDPFALGDEAGIETGDRIMKINGRDLRDFLDFQFYAGSEDRVRLDIVRRSGEIVALEVEVGEGEIWDSILNTSRRGSAPMIVCSVSVIRIRRARASRSSSRTKIPGYRFCMATTPLCLRSR